ncbi:MAG: hypothetical protein JO015_08955 [Verrucomicrobia bacterium]|nr:hypothetical protein [Verrucomicrobiota bacterium]
MPEEFAPTDDQLRRYYRRELNPDEFIALSDYLAKHPEERRLKLELMTGHRLAETGQGRLPKFDHATRYNDIVAKLEGEVADPVERQALEERLAGDPMAATYLTDLAAFKQEMAASPELAGGPDSGRGDSGAIIIDGHARPLPDSSLKVRSDHSSPDESSGDGHEPRATR